MIVSSEMVHFLVEVSWNGRDGCWWIVGTLLGPERTGIEGSRGVPFFACSFSGLHLFPHRPACLPCLGCVCSVFGGACGWGFRLLFENCTVDASIFVAKFLRAHGGCLGTRSR